MNLHLSFSCHFSHTSQGQILVFRVKMEKQNLKISNLSLVDVFGRYFLSQSVERGLLTRLSEKY